MYDSLADQQIGEGKGVKSFSFGASAFGGQHLAIGDFSGELRIHDLEKDKVFYRVKAHKEIINSVDGVGGMDIGYGAPEILTGSRDGSVKLWDPRQNTPVRHRANKGPGSRTQDCRGRNQT